MPDYIYLLENRLSPAQQNALREVRDTARNAGMTVFLAGGAVRDMTSGFPVRDLDFSVQGNALKLKKQLEKSGATVWGEHEPSRTLYFWFPGSVRVEVTSCRREEYPKPGKPVYHWAPILEDLRRRDFTANAMAISLNEGSWGLLLDPLNGFADIETRHLRLASNYGFIEDPSRMIRAVRLGARTGWEMDPRTKTRYQNAKDEGLAEQISSFARGYELEEIAHEEDPVRVLRALEAEGWMKDLCPAWTVAKADLKGLDELNKVWIRLLMLGVNPDPSAAHMELLTAKMTPKDVSSLRRLFPRTGFVDQWNHLEASAKGFAKELLGKSVSTPSATWKLIVNYEPESVLWLAFSSKNPQIREKFDNFFNIWPEARQKIPAMLMSEMRITPDLPEYGKVAEELFFQIMDGKLQTEEEMRAFLAPYSPPAPPPPVVFRRPRGRRAEPKFEEDVELETPAPRSDGDEEAEETEETGNGEDSDLRLPPKPAAETKGKAAKAEKSGKGAKEPVKAETAAAGESKNSGKAQARSAGKAEPKPAAKAATPAKSAVKQPETKSAAKQAEPKTAAKKVELKGPARSAAKAAPKPPAKKAAQPAAKKAAPASRGNALKTAKAAAKPSTKKSAKPAKPVKNDKKKKR
ncbi:MAG: CCA tRNA nucleotidyltransferase [Acidobacteriaceae bacterium]